MANDPEIMSSSFEIGVSDPPLASGLVFRTQAAAVLPL